MKLSDLSIQRPVMASMLSIALVLLGVIGYLNLAVREFPDVDPPIISVQTALPGANPQVVESAVTESVRSAERSPPPLKPVPAVMVRATGT